MKVVRIGILPQTEIRGRMLAIASGKLKPKSSDPRIWFTSMRSLSQVLSDENRALLEVIRTARPASISRRAAKTLKPISPVEATRTRAESFGRIPEYLSARMIATSTGAAQVQRGHLQDELAIRPARRLAPLQQRLDVAQRRLPAAIQRGLQVARDRLERSMRTLNAVSPLATLERGYAIVTTVPDSRVLTDAVFFLNFLFLGGRAPAVPYPGCDRFPGCPAGCKE